MSNSYKHITPAISEIKTGTPGLKIGGKYVVGGIGGDFIPGGTEEQEVILGCINADGNFQPLAFNGTEASNDGSPETVESYYGWNGTLPSPSGGIRVIQGGDAVYYKCASVDTVSKTWTGYLAVLSDGIYTFEETATAGLAYGNGFNPSVNGIYNQDATVTVQRLFTGVDETLVFHASLAAEAATAETGQAMAASGTVQYMTYGGRECAYFYNARLTVDDVSNLPVNGSDMTVTGWFNFADIYNFNHLFGYGDECVIRAVSNKIQFVYNSGGINDVSSPIESNVWYHAAGTWNGSVATLYVNGVSVATSTKAVNFNASRPLTIGAADRSGNGNGYISDIRIYNRCLTAEEIAAIAAE